MRTLERNKQMIYYALYENSEPLLDEYGNETGQYVDTYSDPTPFRINVSAARGESSIKQFGEIENYDKTLITDDLNCPIRETSLIWIGEINTLWSKLESQRWESLEGKSWKEISTLPHNYIVTKVAKSLNSIQFAVRRVNVGG